MAGWVGLPTFSGVKHSFSLMLSVALGLGGVSLGQAADGEFARAVATLRAVGGEGQGNEAAGQALQRLAKGSPESIPALLESMDGANPFASNYLRGAVEVIAGNTLAKGGALRADRCGRCRAA